MYVYVCVGGKEAGHMRKGNVCVNSEEAGIYKKRESVIGNHTHTLG